MQRGYPRSGLRIRAERGHPAVGAALVRFARWLRREFEFPVRVPVYLLPTASLRTRDGRSCSASIFLPWSRRVEPYIRIATGDFEGLRRKHGRDDTLGVYLHSLSHEIVHYRQWIETGRSWEAGVIRQAERLVDRYARTVQRP